MIVERESKNYRLIAIFRMKRNHDRSDHPQRKGFV